MTYPSAPDSQDYPRMTPAVQALIAINVAMLFLQRTVVSGLPSVLAYEGEPLRAWWTPVTYMFVHAGLWHLALNMYTLWIFGPRVEHLWGTKRFVWFYLWCGLGGVLAHALFGPDGSSLVGASAAIFGVMFAFAWQWPREEIYLFGVLPMRVSVLVGLLAGINLLQGVGAAATGSVGSGVAYLAHLGGFAFAFLYLHAPGPGSIERLRQHVSSVPDGSESPRAIPPRTARSRTRVDEVDEIVAKSKAIVGKQKQRQPARGALPRPAAEPKPTEVDRLLDKISAEGMASLTDEEREILSEFSRRLRGR